MWYKHIPHDFSMAMAEYAWCSHNANAKVYEYLAMNQPGRFHPTQKPIQLYKAILNDFAKPGDKILDTHVGSASSLIACEELGFQYVGFEINPDYYKKGIDRLEVNRSQLSLFREGEWCDEYTDGLL